jgi:hypothetical protein
MDEACHSREADRPHALDRGRARREQARARNSIRPAGVDPKYTRAYPGCGQD